MLLALVDKYNFKFDDLMIDCMLRIINYDDMMLDARELEIKGDYEHAYILYYVATRTYFRKRDMTGMSTQFMITWSFAAEKVDEQLSEAELKQLRREKYNRFFQSEFRAKKHLTKYDDCGCGSSGLYGIPRNVLLERANNRRDEALVALNNYVKSNKADSSAIDVSDVDIDGENQDQLSEIASQYLDALCCMFILRDSTCLLHCQLLSRSDRRMCGEADPIDISIKARRLFTACVRGYACAVLARDKIIVDDVIQETQDIHDDGYDVMMYGCRLLSDSIRCMS